VPEDPLERLLEKALASLRLMREEAYWHLLNAAAAEELFYERLRSLSEGVLEPLVEIHDLGEEIVVIVDASGAKRETLEVLVGEDRVEVRGEADERVYREALGSTYYRSVARRFHGVYTLPARVDPKTVRVEKRGSLIIVRVRKAGG